MKKHRLLLLLIWFMMSEINAQMPNINGVTPLTVGAIGKYDKYELRVDLTANVTNPYDYDAQILRGIFTAPNGRKDTCF